MRRGRREPELVDLQLELRHETFADRRHEGAFLLHDGSRDGWVPKSMCEDNRDGTFTMPRWKAKELGFI